MIGVGCRESTRAACLTSRAVYITRCRARAICRKSQNSNTFLSFARLTLPESGTYTGPMFHWRVAMFAVSIAVAAIAVPPRLLRSEEHTSELQSLRHLVCRLLLEKKKTI